VDQPGDVEVAMLRVDRVAKSFGETTALSACSFEVARGETHALIGENGSGKSTLVKILAGIVRPGRGRIGVADTWLEGGIRSPAASRQLGIAPVFQEILLVSALSVLANVYLGRDGLLRAADATVSRRAAAEALLRRLSDRPIDLDVSAGTLDLSDRQVCAITRALLQEPRVLLLDESTSALDVRVRRRLFEVVREFCARGGSVLFISHRMDEVAEIADRVTILRSGVSVASLPRGEATPSTLLSLMSGERQTHHAAGRGTGGPTARAGTIIQVRDLILNPGGLPASLAIGAGEVVGLGGLEGHGQDEFLRTLAGLRRPARGSITVVGADGKEVHIRTFRDARRHGIAYVPRERKTEGIFAPLSLLDNFAMPSLGRDARLGLLSNKRQDRRFRAYHERLEIRMGSPRDPITSLSGGNQQKIMLARWLATEPRILLLNDPTRGVDHATKQDLYALFGEISRSGIAIVLLSTEVDELITLTDRVFVFREGSLFAELPRRQLERQRLVASFFGQIAS
jgi:ABC-type sugar transport system ATPase subunit